MMKKLCFLLYNYFKEKKLNNINFKNCSYISAIFKLTLSILKTILKLF